jgi:hypothetical protein
MSSLTGLPLSVSLLFPPLARWATEMSPLTGLVALNRKLL